MPSFDVVSRVDLQEVDNALNQTRKEVAQRYDLKDAKTEIEWDEKVFTVTSADDFKVKAVVDVLQSKLVRRNVPIKNLDYGKVEPAAGGRARQVITVQQGIVTEKARAIVKRIKTSGIKVQSQITEDEVRVSGKKRDDLQAVIEMLAHTVPARLRPAASLQALERAVERAAVLKGERGEAADLAPRLLQILEAQDGAVTAPAVPSDHRRTR